MSIEHKWTENKCHDQNKTKQELTQNGGFVEAELFCSGQKTFVWILYLFSLLIPH